MPKSDAEWQALDERLAREVMGWHKRLFWWSVDESGCPVSVHLIPGWQPHLDVEQALEALDTVADKYPGVGYTLERATPKRLRGYMCALGNPDAPETLAFAPTLREAICLAIEAWLDAQEEAQDG